MPISKSHVIWQSWTTWAKTPLSTDVSKHSTAMFVWWHSRARTVATSSPGRTATARPASVPRASVKLAQFSTQHFTSVALCHKFHFLLVRDRIILLAVGLMPGALLLLAWVLTMSSCVNKHESTTTLGHKCLMHMCGSSTHAPVEGAWQGRQVVRCTSINKLLRYGFKTPTAQIYIYIYICKFI